MAESTEPKISSITLDDATRARVAQELGFADGIDAVPAEIAIVAVQPEEAGLEESEVSGFSLLRQSNAVFYNPSVTPAVSANRYQSTYVSAPAQNRWVMVTVV
jgi:hypothetical protein